MKKAVVLILLLLFLVPATALAHTELKSSFPKQDEVIEQPLKEIMLTFNTDLEKLSTLSLFDENEKKVNVDTIEVKANVLSAALSTTLANGNYKIDWKIVGADGHVINQSFSFQMAVPILPETETLTGKSFTEEIIVKEAPAQEPSPSIPQDDQIALNISNIGSSSSSLFIWIGVCSLIVIAILANRIWRKRT
ncbi:copper resistance CopC family protein [Paenibacillus typhae]